MTRIGRPPTILFVNDNHCVAYDDRFEFENSAFHKFLRAFPNAHAVLSSPCLDRHGNSRRASTVIDGVNVWTRTGYGRAQSFYANLPSMLVRGGADLWRHIRHADAVIVVLPACFAPVTYAIALLLRKPIFVYVVGDVRDVVQAAESYTGLARTASRLVARWEAFVTRHLARRHTTFALGRRLQALLREFGIESRNAMTSLVRTEQIRSPTSAPPLQQLRLVSVGRLSAEKGFDIALTALQQLLREGWDVTYTIVGSGPLESHLRDRIEEAQLDGRVELAGSRTQEQIVSTIYPEHDIFVLSSLSEGIPKVLLEAMAAALPIVASNVGGVVDLLGKDQERGWLVPPNDSSALAKAIRACAADPVARQRRTEAATSFIRNHTMEAEASAIERVIVQEIDPGLARAAASDQEVS